MKRPLLGITVLDMTTVIFGPYCTASLAAMGARVIKIKPPAGDESAGPVHSRGMGPLFMTLNECKESVVLDMKSADGRRALEELVRGPTYIHPQPATTYPSGEAFNYPQVARQRVPRQI